MSMRTALIISAVVFLIYYPLGLLITPIMIAIAAITTQERKEKEK